jgi:hypothetical protein
MPSPTNGIDFDLWKKAYGAKSNALYMTGALTGDVLEGMVPKETQMIGEEGFQVAITTSFGGSAGFNKLPTNSNAKNVKPTIYLQQAYARLEVTGPVLKASQSNQTAFVDAQKELESAKVRSFGRLQACATYGDDRGALGQFTAAATGTAAAPVVTISATGTYGFRLAYFEEGDILEIEKDVLGTPILQSDKFTITAVNETTRAISLARLGSSVDLTNVAFNAQTHNLVFEGASILNTNGGKPSGTRRLPMGILAACNFTSGTLYGVPFQRRYSPFREDLGGRMFTADVINKVTLRFFNRTGIAPTEVIASFRQFESLCNQAEYKKDYTMVPGSKVGEYAFGFGGINILTPNGPLRVYMSRFLKDDVIIFTNVKAHCRKFTMYPQWLDFDGSVFDRIQDDDAYEARFGAYYDNLWNPFAIGYVFNASLPA